MAISCFTVKDHIPTTEEINITLGSTTKLWNSIVEFIFETYELTGEFNYGGKNYGWNLWYRKSGKSLITLYPQEGGIIAQVVLGKEQVEKALLLDLGESVNRLLRDTPQLHDGKWLFIQVRTEVEVDAVQRLLLIKRKPVKRK